MGAIYINKLSIPTGSRWVLFKKNISIYIMISKKFINRHAYIWTHKVLYTHILIPKPKPKPKRIIPVKK